MVRFNFPSLLKKVSTDVLAVQSDGSQTDGIIKQDISFILQPVLEQLDDDAVMWSNWKKKNRQTETEMSVKSRSASLRLLLGSGNLRLNPAGKQTNWRNDHSREEYNQTVTDVFWLIILSLKTFYACKEKHTIHMINLMGAPTLSETNEGRLWDRETMTRVFVQYEIQQ